MLLPLMERHSLKADDPQLKSQYRMPRVFGALPGPRNVPRDKQHLANRQRNLLASISVLTDAKALAELLPLNCMLDGDPVLTMNFLYMKNIGWLAGRGYALISAGFRIAYESPSQGLLKGNFLPVIWENLADPILTGREELGWAKLYAQIPEPLILGEDYRGSAGWDGFRFLDFEIAGCRDEAPAPGKPVASFHHKYVPRTGALNQADVDYLEYAPAGQFATGYGGMTVERHLAGKGVFAFRRASWEDVPFQYPIINALADLPLLEPRGASVTYSTAREAIGDTAGGALKRID